MSILLDVLRHGAALPCGEGGDRQRTLAPRGVRCLTALAERLRGEGWRPDRAFSSPLRRARDSAQIVLQGAEAAVPIEVLEALEPDAEPSEVLDALAEQGVTGGHVLVVGHQPLLGRLVGHLAGSEKALSPGTLVRIECPWDLGQGTGRVVLTHEPGDLAHP